MGSSTSSSASSSSSDSNYSNEGRASALSTTNAAYNASTSGGTSSNRSYGNEGRASALSETNKAYNAATTGTSSNKSYGNEGRSPSALSEANRSYNESTGGTSSNADYGNEGRASALSLANNPLYSWVLGSEWDNSARLPQNSFLTVEDAELRAKENQERERMETSSKLRQAARKALTPEIVGKAGLGIAAGGFPALFGVGAPVVTGLATYFSDSTAEKAREYADSEINKMLADGTYRDEMAKVVLDQYAPLEGDGWYGNTSSNQDTKQIVKNASTLAPDKAVAPAVPAAPAVTAAPEPSYVDLLANSSFFGQGFKPARYWERTPA